jgi:hypothetical protein
MRKLLLGSNSLRIVAAALTIVSVTARPGASAFAADLPVKVPQADAVAQSNGLYFWMDGSAQSINLPRFDLGDRHVDSSGTKDLGAVTSFDPRATGAGVAAGIGYVLPYGTLPSMFGTNVRLEAGASFVHASARQTASGSIQANDNGILPALNATAGADLSFCQLPCLLNSTLSTDYSAWAMNGKAVSDFKSGLITWSPSLAVFGGRDRNSQDFTQHVLGPEFFDFRYSAHSTLDWTDWGTKAGLTVNADVTTWLGLGLGGSLGFASRHA